MISQSLCRFVECQEAEEKENEQHLRVRGHGSPCDFVERPRAISTCLLRHIDIQVACNMSRGRGDDMKKHKRTYIGTTLGPTPLVRRNDHRWVTECDQRTDVEDTSRELERERDRMIRQSGNVRGWRCREFGFARSIIVLGWHETRQLTAYKSTGDLTPRHQSSGDPPANKQTWPTR